MRCQFISIYFWNISVKSTFLILQYLFYQAKFYFSTIALALCDFLCVLWAGRGGAGRSGAGRDATMDRDEHRAASAADPWYPHTKHLLLQHWLIELDNGDIELDKNRIQISTLPLMPESSWSGPVSSSGYYRQSSHRDTLRLYCVWSGARWII